MLVRKKKSKKKAKAKPSFEIVPVDFDKTDAPENYPTLLKYLEAKGKIKHTSQIQLSRARHLYVVSGRTPQQIAKSVGTIPSVIQRWIVTFGWSEERDRRLFEKFRKMSGEKTRLLQNVDEQHDLIAANVEEIVRWWLERHADGKAELGPKDLQTLLAALGKSRDIRLSARGKAGSLSERKVEVNVNMPEQMERLSAAIAALAEEKTMIPVSNVKRLEVKVMEGIGQDREFDDQE